MGSRSDKRRAKRRREGEGRRLRNPRGLADARPKAMKKEERHRIAEELEPEVDLSPDPFYLEDRWGDDHEYTTVYYPAGPGFDFALELLGLMERALEKLEGVDLGDMMPIEIFGLVGAGVSDISREILAAGGHQIALELLATTYRDGVQLNLGGFELAYQGNQFELLCALGKVIAINYGDFFEAGSLWSGQKKGEAGVDQEADLEPEYEVEAGPQFGTTSDE